MPIYEYVCKNCENEFELLVLKGTEPACPACKSSDLERLLSLPNVKSEITHDKAMRAARRRDKSQATERVETQREYEKSHDDEGH
jgi:putative FmdB family regulatory protein